MKDRLKARDSIHAELGRSVFTIRCALIVAEEHGFDSIAADLLMLQKEVLRIRSSVYGPGINERQPGQERLC